MEPRIDYNAIVDRRFMQGGFFPILTRRINGIDIPDYNRILPMLEEWAAAHPVRTYAEDFREKFPNCVMENECPAACLSPIYGEDAASCGLKCADCWNRPMPDVKGE